MQVSVQIQIPDDLPQTGISIGKLLNNWRSFPAPEELKEIGTVWARKRKTGILAVPSVVISNETNYLINPGNDKTKRVKIISIAPFTLDVRLYRGRSKNKR